ncbi:hypothetical protein OG352_20480 [Streptomyces sp. NBC_01485]|uniref:hypothetical protein n=1 Tax=Streptomyces sp. NBC_01485 TaxID=2903884 RepID=UPI002E31CB17|nr:hypothetical protein [Streptomyces sp. NBC_01485]
MGTQPKDLYPDVTASGDLASAMNEAAKQRGCDMGRFFWVTDDVCFETARGNVSVHSATEERLFRLRVYIPDFSWEIGSTDDLGLLVETVAAWREGVPLDELKARFEFLELDEFAGALERGEPASSQWSKLLSTEFHREQWNLLRRLHADEVLGRMFPVISHRAVRLQMDPLNWQSRQVLVHEPDEERYEVRAVVPGSSWVAVPSGDLIAHLRAALTEQ